MMQKEEVTRAKDKNRKVTDEECLRDGTKLSPVRSLLSNSDRSESKIQSTDYTSLKVPFPWRLWQLLEDSEKNGTQSIVSWLPDGDGFTIFKPVVFTSTIMKVYFTLTCYESFTHELQRYGFTLAVPESGTTRVDIFRNPRYNRNDKTKSLALRRKSTTRTLSDRLSAKKLLNSHHRLKPTHSQLHPFQTQEDETTPMSPSAPHHVNNNSTRSMIEHSDIVSIGEDTFTPTPFRPNESYFSLGSCGDLMRTPGRSGDFSEVDSWSILQQTQGNARSVPCAEVFQSLDSMFLSPSDCVKLQDDSNDSIPLSSSGEQQQASFLSHDDEWRTCTHNENCHLVLQKDGSSLLDDNVFPMTDICSSVQDDELPDTLPSNDFSFPHSGNPVSSMLDNLGPRPELERSLDEDIMDSIFD